MARIKNEHGLTPQQEQFCQYVVDAYGSDTKGILVAAYRKAYNCRSDAKPETHWSKASELYNNGKVRARIEQLREEVAKLVTIDRERLISDDVKIANLDLLDLWKVDEKTHQWRLRYIHEIPKELRRLLSFKLVGKRLIPDIDKEKARQRLMAALNGGNLGGAGGLNMSGVLRIGFDD